MTEIPRIRALADSAEHVQAADTLASLMRCDG